MTEESSYKEFNEAMAKFQSEYDPPKKDKKVDFTTAKGQRIKYEYSDLESLQKAIRITASKHGLSWNTDFEYREFKSGLMIIAKVVINHSSGTQKTFSGVPLITNSTDPQSIGSIKTYSERYALGGAFGIASDSDDDGQIAKSGQDNVQNNSKKREGKNNAENQFNNNKAELKRRLTAVADQTGKEYKNLEQYVINKANEQLSKQFTNINSQNIGVAIGYVKALEVEAKKKSNNNEQQSMMQGNTTNPVDWGN